MYTQHARHIPSQRLRHARLKRGNLSLRNVRFTAVATQPTSTYSPPDHVVVHSSSDDRRSIAAEHPITIPLPVSRACPANHPPCLRAWPHSLVLRLSAPDRPARPRPAHSAHSCPFRFDSPQALIAGVFVLGIGTGVTVDSAINTDPRDLASRDAIDRNAPNPNICQTYGSSAMVVDQRVFVTFNPFSLHVSQVWLGGDWLGDKTPGYVSVLRPSTDQCRREDAANLPCLWTAVA